MSNITVPISGNETIDTFLTMKDGLGLLLPQLQVIQSFDVLSSIGSLANEMMTSMSTYEQQIAELSHQLCSKMQQYADLRASIDKNRLSYPATEGSETIKEMSPRSSPISRCPDVILDSIFEAVAEEGSHNILSLLTVSKRFHRLAMSNPLLWRKIFITIDDNLTEINSLSAPYIKACLERSGNAPLDVILDCDELLGGHEFMRKYIYDLLDRSAENEQDKEDISSHLDGEFRDDEDGDGWDFPLYERKLEPLLDIIHALAGPKGINVCRWRSTVISYDKYSRNSITKAIRKLTAVLLKAEMPNFQSLEINHANYSRPGRGGSTSAKNQEDADGS